MVAPAENTGSMWHVLDVRAIWIKEFASALGKLVPTLGWLPTITNTGRLQRSEHEEISCDPPLRIRRFPLQRGFARWPIDSLTRENVRIVHRLARQNSGNNSSVLVCCSPHYAAVAEKWPGPVVYYVTDYFPAYWHEPQHIKSLDRRMCDAADLVCPNSQRIANYLLAEAYCSKNKLVVVPNATREANLLPEPTFRPSQPPKDIADLPRPIAGILGNLASNIDWVLLRDVIAQTFWLSWVFVGPTDMPVDDPDQREAREILMSQRGRVRFIGYRAYSQLCAYARSFDVSILPYRKVEPTYSGSSTRFYEHLAACRPILSTQGFEELLRKEPLLKLVDSAAEMVRELVRLKSRSFCDGFEEVRWQASLSETWEARASVMQRYVSSSLLGIAN